MPAGSLMSSKMQQDRLRKRNAALAEMTFHTGADEIGEDSETMRTYKRVQAEMQEAQEQHKKNKFRMMPQKSIKTR